MTTRKSPGHPPTPSNESSRLAALLRFERLEADPCFRLSYPLYFRMKRYDDA